MLFHYAIRFLKSKEATEDACNEIFLKLWKNREQLQAVTSLQAYLLVAVRNTSLNTLKRISRQEAARANIEGHFPGTSLSAESLLLEKEYVAFLQRCIETLPPRSQQVFRLCREQEFTYEEVSTVLGISKHAVKHHMMLSLKKIKALIQKELGISSTILFFFTYL